MIEFLEAVLVATTRVCVCVCVLQASSGQVPGMLLNILQNTGQPSSCECLQNYLAPNVNSAELEKLCYKGIIDGFWFITFFICVSWVVKTHHPCFTCVYFYGQNTGFLIKVKKLGLHRMVLGYKGLDLSVNSFHQGTELSSRLSVLEKWEDCERLKKKRRHFLYYHELQSVTGEAFLIL